MPALFASHGLLHAPSHIRPWTCFKKCKLTRAAQGTLHCKQRWSVPVSIREGEPQEDDFDGLSKEEDWTVPGGAFDSLSSNTQLGKAVQQACDELDTLVTLERQSLTDAQDMLKKLGYKGNILQADTPQEQSQAAAQIQQILEATDRDRPVQE
ncbi:g5882 [Coccomyxa viridis]|uniref:G5882 protein n=1 Tax=Coccomyxa viridis TaxID=1274662 RepID=A0ABP1G0N6_9CHLO